MSPVLDRFRSRVLGFPRVSGDEPQIRTAIEIKVRFSPRERG